MNRRAIGWLLLLGSPGVAAGITLTLFFALRGFDLVLWGAWGAASVASAVGGYLVSPATARIETRFLLGVAGFAFGAGVFLIAMVVTADKFIPSF